MLLVTGGAGFIGSNVVAALNDAGRADVAVCDILGHDGKWRNLAKRQLADIVPPAELADWLKGRRLEAVIHLGAISETTATDGDLVIETNFRLSMRLLDWCTANGTPFIYASSAATYGDGGLALDDRPGLWSKGAPGSSGALREALRRAELFLLSSSAPPQRRRRTWCDALGWLLRTHPSSTPEMTRSAELDLQTVQPRRDSRPYSFYDGSNRFYSCGAIGELVTRKEKLALAPVESRSIKTRTCAQA